MDEIYRDAHGGPCRSVPTLQVESKSRTIGTSQIIRSYRSAGGLSAEDSRTDTQPVAYPDLQSGHHDPAAGFRSGTTISRNYGMHLKIQAREKDDGR